MKTPKANNEVRKFLSKIASLPRKTKGTQKQKEIARNAALARWQREHPPVKKLENA